MTCYYNLKISKGDKELIDFCHENNLRVGIIPLKEVKQDGVDR